MNVNVNVSSRSLESRALTYGSGAIAYHWITAALIAVVGAIGLFFDDFPRSAFPGWLTVHATLGLAILVLVFFRMGWRARHTPPDLPRQVGEISRRTSHAAHLMIYALLVLTPILGLMTFIAHGRSFVFGPLSIGFPFASTPSVFHPTEVAHQWLAYGLFGLAGVHIGAALYHHVVLGDGLIGRILPAARR